MDPREFKFKAWNTETRLLMRLDHIDCIRGSLYKKDHILLQYTGVTDKSGSELYEYDIVLIGSSRSMIIWDDARNGWSRIAENGSSEKIPLQQQEMETSVKLCNYYESPDSFKRSF